MSTSTMAAAAGTSTVTLGTSKLSLENQPYTINFTITSTDSPELTNDEGKTYYVTQLTSTPTYSDPIQKQNEHGVGTFKVEISVSEADVALWNADSSKTTDTVVNFTLTSADPVKLLNKDASTTNGALGAKSANVEATQTIVVTITSAGVASVTSVGGASGINGKYAVRGSAGYQDQSSLEASLATDKLTVSL